MSARRDTEFEEQHLLTAQHHIVLLYHLLILLASQFVVAPVCLSTLSTLLWSYAACHVSAFGPASPFPARLLTYFFEPFIATMQSFAFCFALQVSITQVTSLQACIAKRTATPR